MATHTPGPWMVHQPGSLRACDGQHESEDGCRTLVEAEIVGIPRPEAEANVRLIAAAPELLAGCRAAYDWIATYGDDRPSVVKLSIALRAVIEKAEGR